MAELAKDGVNAAAQVKDSPGETSSLPGIARITPLIIAAVAIPTAFAFIYALTYLTTMSTLVQNIVALVGLGVAIDYALLIVTRWPAPS